MSNDPAMKFFTKGTIRKFTQIFLPFYLHFHYRSYYCSTLLLLCSTLPPCLPFLYLHSAPPSTFTLPPLLFPLYPPLSPLHPTSLPFYPFFTPTLPLLYPLSLPPSTLTLPPSIPSLYAHPIPTLPPLYPNSTRIRPHSKCLISRTLHTNKLRNRCAAGLCLTPKPSCSALNGAHCSALNVEQCSILSYPYYFLFNLLYQNLYYGQRKSRAKILTPSNEAEKTKSTKLH